MKDPRRWLDQGGGARPDERALLRGGLDMDPPRGAEDATWTALAARLGGPAGGGPDNGGTGTATGGNAAAGAKAMTATGLLKPALFAVLTAGVVASAVAVLRLGPEPARDSTLDATISAVEVTPAEVDATPALEAAPANGAARANEAAPALEARPIAGATDPALPGAEHRAITAPPATAAGGAARVPDRTDRPENPPPHHDVFEPATAEAAAEPPATAAPTSDPAALAGASSGGGAALVAKTERESRLREESQLLGQARAALRAGDAGGALRLLDLAWTRFPGGVLVQEREALAIEALARSGQRGAAAARARAFLVAFPRSPHAERIATFAY